MDSDTLGKIVAVKYEERLLSKSEGLAYWTFGQQWEEVAYIDVSATEGSYNIVDSLALPSRT